MSVKRRLRKLFAWVIILSLCIVAGGLWFAYLYLTDGEAAARLIKQSATRFLPGSVLDPGRVKIGLARGEVTLTRAILTQTINGASFPALDIAWLSVLVDSHKLWNGQLEAREVNVGHPTLRLREREDGTWNIQGLLADPWPVPLLENPPPINIQNGTVELVSNEEPLAPGLSPPRRRSAKRAAILRDVSLKIEGNGGAGRFKFDGWARGDMFDKLSLSGTIDTNTGRITLAGDLTGLTLSETLRRRLPPEARPTFEAIALNSGVVDVELSRLSYDPTARPENRLRYQALATLREGVWECTKLPFPVNDLRASVAFEDGFMTIKYADGSNGKTDLHAQGSVALEHFPRGPFDLRLSLEDLELDDQRLRDHTPAEFAEIWGLFQPRGRVDAKIEIARRESGGPPDLAATVDCRDVGAVYRHFPYPLEHLKGKVKLVNRFLTVDLDTSSVGNQPLHLKGEIKNPGLDAEVKLEINARSIPIDPTLKKAMPPNVRKVVEQFHPGGLVSAAATVVRMPMVGPSPTPEGEIRFDAVIDLGEQCEMKWDGLPYAVRDLKGKLEIHPDCWVFHDMRGRNGQTEVLATGSVAKLPIAKLENGDDPLDVQIHLELKNLPLVDELRASLPPAWREKTWSTINPSGASDVEADVRVRPGEEHTRIVIAPRPESNVRLVIERPPQPGDPGGVIELPLENVSGRFVFDDGLVTMNDVNFQFRGSPVGFQRGSVKVEDSGRFDLSVMDLNVQAIRFDQDLRKKMPPLMAQFARRLDDGKTFRARGDLQIGWSGEPGRPAWCRWEHALAVFDDNSINTGIPIEHIYGQIDHVSGWSDGNNLKVDGVVNLASVSVLGQQVTRVESPFHVGEGRASLESVSGHFLKGELLGSGSISLNTTPQYSLKLMLNGAQLQEYGRTLPGRQNFRGVIDARLECSGLGNDVHSLNGIGSARVTEGDLGELPLVLRFARELSKKILLSDSPRGAAKTAFDSADVDFKISHGLSTLDPIKFTGNAFSLRGKGTLDPQGNLDLKLDVLLGRDRFHIPGVSSSPLVIAHVQGTPTYPQFRLEFLPQFYEFLKAVGQLRAERRPASTSP
jgi:hypothetical protein